MFEHLRLIKAEKMLSENLCRTLETRSQKAQEESAKNKDTITQIEDYRTRKTITNTKKELHIEAQFINGASDGKRHEPDFAKLAQQCLHETEIMTRLEKWCKKFKIKF
jgi:hypothetical protein